MTMASDENVNRNSCIYDPNFAIVCSFFENFSSLCGVKHPPFSDLQQMLDSTDEISPELIDLHVRLMRKAKKNVNPDRWQRTLAKFCYFYSPQDSWELEQHGYKKLHYEQRLRILLCLCEAQFDQNIKFKNDINKLPIDELRLSPIGKDKDGIKYWIQTDEKLDLKLYKENPEEETFELIATDRDGLVKLIEELKSGRDPDRKFEEPSEESSSEEEPDIKDEPDPEQTIQQESTPESQSQSEPTETPSPKEEKPEPPKGPVEHKIQHVDVKTKRFEKSPEIVLKKEKIPDTSPKTLKPEEFAQHIEKLKSEKILLPLLTSPLPFKESLKSSGNESLKTKINMKFNMIKPVLQNEVLMSKIEDVKKKDLYKKMIVKREDNVNNYVMQINKSKEAKAGKPGLKLEQILKSKLAQKLAANEPSVDQKSIDTADNPQPDREIQPERSPSGNESTKRKLSDTEPAKRSKVETEDEEIEEPLMLVTGVGNGKDCECGYESDECEFVLFIQGVGSGRDCDTGNNENEEDKDKHASLTHKVDDMLSKNEDDTPSTSDEPKKADECEKKKPKLWTIDAICNSDSKDNVKKDDISCFPNYSFNIDKKPETIGYRNEYSYFGVPVESKDNDIIATNFYFGCDTQPPAYATEVRNYKTKSHNVKDIVQLDGDKDNEYSTSYNSNEAFNLCTRPKSPSKKENDYSNVMNLSNTEDSKRKSNERAINNISSIVPYDDSDEGTDNEQSEPQEPPMDSLAPETKVETESSVISKIHEAIESPNVEICEKIDSNIEPAEESEPSIEPVDETMEDTTKNDVEIETVKSSEQSKLENENFATDQLKISPSQDLVEKIEQPEESNIEIVTKEQLPEPFEPKPVEILKPDDVKAEQNVENRIEEGCENELKDEITEHSGVVEQSPIEPSEVSEECKLLESQPSAAESSPEYSEPLPDEASPEYESECETVVVAPESVQPATEATPESESKPEISATETQPITVESVSETETECKIVNAAAETETEPKIADAAAETETEPKIADAAAETETEPKIADAAPKTETESKIVEPETETEPIAKPAPETEPKIVEPETETEPIAKPAPPTEPNTVAPVTETEPKIIQPVPETEPEPITAEPTPPIESQTLTSQAAPPCQPDNEHSIEPEPRTDIPESIDEPYARTDILTESETVDNEQTNEQDDADTFDADDPADKSDSDQEPDTGSVSLTESSTKHNDKPKPKPVKRRGKRGAKSRKKPKPKIVPVKPKNQEAAEENDTQDEDNEQDETKKSPKDEIMEKPAKTPNKRKTLKRGWLNEIDVRNITPTTGTGVGIRQSRRIAQLKIKEQAEGKYVDHTTSAKKTPKSDTKSKPVSKKNNKTPTKKCTKGRLIQEESDGEDSNYEKSSSTCKKKRKKKDSKKKYNAGDPWKATSDSSTEEDAEEDDHFEEEEDDDEIAPNDVSDHEFSPESDVDDEDFVPVKRARTAHSKPKTEDKSERDDLCCQKCRTAEQPEWILLCDKCDEGWHAACLRPPLMSIPEGDWYCPPCQHNMLITSLHKFLKSYDKNVKKRDNEELRRKRLEYVGISFSNIINEQTQHDIKEAKDEEFVEYELSEDNTSEDEPLYTLRIRRQANVSYRLNEYDELMNSAIQRENDAEATENGEIKEPPVVPVAVEEKVEEQVEEKEEESSEEEEESNEDKVSPMMLQMRGIRKKPARLTKLDVSSDDDHFSDEDFKGTSGDDYDEDEYVKSETDSDEARYRKSNRGPVRRSTRARVTRYDNDFINDEDSEEEDYEPKKKKKRSRNSDSDSEEEDSTWGKRKRSKYSRVHRSLSKKKRRRIVFEGDSDDEKKDRKDKKGKKSRVTYGLEDDEDDYPQRRTRGKKINYLENLGTDSDDENGKSASKSKKTVSDDDDYVNEDDERAKGAIAVENGNKNDATKATDKGYSNASSLHELIATNNTSVIRTYSKSNKSKNEDDLETGVVGEEKTKPADVPYAGMVTPDGKIVSNPSLEGMQSMAQMISSPSNYSVPMARKMIPMGDGPYAVPGAGPYPEVGIGYEDGEGTGVSADGDKYPVRVVSPNRMYGPDGQALATQMVARPPYVMGPGMAAGMPPNPMLRMPAMHLRGPPPNAIPAMGNTMQAMSQAPAAGANPVMEAESPKRRARGRGKKQLEIERMKRDMPPARADEMMPLHMLKPMANEMNARPPTPYGSPSPPSFANYSNMPRLPYSTAAPVSPSQSAVTVSVGNSKRVKITPTRMRMPTPQNVMRFPRPPGMMHGSHMPLDPSPSGGSAVPLNNGENAIPPQSQATPGNADGGVKKESLPEQYYQPASYAPASQIPRGFNQRPEFAFAQKPLPPMYQPSSGAATVIRPTVTTNTVITGPISSQGTTPPSKPETPVSSPNVSYSAPYPVPATSGSPTSKSITPPTSQPIPVIAPPTSAYQALHIKQLPVAQSSAAPFNAAYYAASPIVPNSYAPQSLPPVSSYGPASGTLTQPFPVPGRVPAQSFVKSPQPIASPTIPYTAPTENTNSAEYTSSAPEAGFQYQECNTSVTSSDTETTQFQGNYEEESATVEEQPSGEFGGLVSYFSSQREDDLDA